MPLPLLPAPDRPDVWRSGRYLPLGGQERRWAVAGFPGYEVRGLAGGHAGLMRLAYTDQRGRRRPARQVTRQRKNGTSEGWVLHRNGCGCWVSLDRLRELLRRVG